MIVVWQVNLEVNSLMLSSSTRIYKTSTVGNNIIAAVVLAILLSYVCTILDTHEL